MRAMIKSCTVRSDRICHLDRAEDDPRRDVVSSPMVLFSRKDFTPIVARVEHSQRTDPDL